MPTEIDKEKIKRSVWMDAPMPMVTIFKTLDVTVSGCTSATVKLPSVRGFKSEGSICVVHPCDAMKSSTVCSSSLFAAICGAR